MGNIKIQKNQQEWVFYYEDEEVLKISKEEYFKLGLYSRDYITEKEFDEIKNKVMKIKGRKYALQTNIYNNKSSKQIYEKLIQKGINENIASEIINEMKENGDINEWDIIKRFIKDRLKFNARSKKLIKYELIKKGFMVDDVEYIIEKMCLCDEDIAKQILQRKQKVIKSINDIVRLLKNKGFEYSTIKRIVDQMPDKYK